MSNNPSQFSIGSFVLGIFRGALIVLAGFAISPTHLLYSIYEAHPSLRVTVIFAGILTTIWGLCSMFNISLKVIQSRLEATQQTL